MKKWRIPELTNLSVAETATTSDYITLCNWNEASTYGKGNEEHTDPTKKPAQHPNWVWCQVHTRWHPKDHTGSSESIENPGGLLS